MAIVESFSPLLPTLVLVYRTLLLTSAKINYDSDAL